MRNSFEVYDVKTSIHDLLKTYSKKVHDDGVLLVLVLVNFGKAITESHSGENLGLADTCEFLCFDSFHDLYLRCCCIEYFVDLAEGSLAYLIKKLILLW